MKKFMLVNRKAPYGSIYALESLEVVLIAAAFEQDVSVAFIDDGVYQLKGMQTRRCDQAFFATYRSRLRHRQAVRRVRVAGSARPGGGRPDHRREADRPRCAGRADGAAGRGTEFLRTRSCCTS
jgi:uncharacterized protein YfaS (alpha-2-macroglobulin family)